MDRIVLSNEDRKYLGLTPIGETWESMEIKNVTLYFDGHIIRKMITNTEFEPQDCTYFECDVFVETAENRTIVLPKTSKGKPKKLNYTATTTFSGIGTYVRYLDGNITIGNFTTQQSYFVSRIAEEKPYKEKFMAWLEAWKKDTSEEDLKDIEEFSLEKRKKQKYREGDVFYFKYDRKQYGFGKIVIDVTKRRKDPSFEEGKNYGLDNLMGKALIVKIYHKISNRKDIDINQLEALGHFPLQPMMDNKIYYNEYKIIGNLPVTYKDLDDAMISVSESISGKELGIAYLQYGLIYNEIPLAHYKENKKEHWSNYRNEAIGFNFFIDNFERCIEEKSNKAYYEINHIDLRSPENIKDKEEIFKLFGLDGTLDYEGNLKLASKGHLK